VQRGLAAGGSVVVCVAVKIDVGACELLARKSRFGASLSVAPSAADLSGASRHWWGSKTNRNSNDITDCNINRKAARSAVL